MYFVMKQCNDFEQDFDIYKKKAHLITHALNRMVIVAMGISFHESNPATHNIVP